MNGFTPLYDRVLVTATPIDEISKGGIILVQDDVSKTPTMGKVVSVGPGRYDNNGNLIPCTVKPNDVIMWSKFAGSKIQISGQEYLLMHETDIQGIIK